MYLIKERLKESITKVDITSWEKDFRTFSKDIRKISNGEDFFVVLQALKKWIDQFQKLVFERIKGPKDSTGFLDSENFTNSWNACVGLYNLFSAYSLGLNEHYLEEKFPDYTNKYYKEVYDQLYDEFDKRRNKIYAKFTKFGREAFEELYRVIGDQIIPDKAIEEDYNFKGVRITFVYSEIQDPQTLQVKKEIFLKALDVSLKKTQLKGILYILKNVYFIVQLSDLGIDRSGEYAGKNRIILKRSSLQSVNEAVITILHELGHYIEYVVINKNLKKEWETFYYGLGTKNVSKEIKDNIASLIRKSLNNTKFKEIIELRKNKKIDKYQYSQLALSFLLSQISSETTEYILLDTLLNERRFDYFPELYNNIDQNIQFFINTILTSGNGIIYQDRILLQKISTYASKNEGEGFAELFYLYVSDDYKKYDTSIMAVQFMKNVIGNFQENLVRLRRG